MPRLLPTLLTAAALALGLGGASAQAATINPETPDCVVTCTKTLKTGDRIVVGDRYAFSSVSAYGQANGFLHWVLKVNPRGTGTFTKYIEGYGTSFSVGLWQFSSPALFPGQFRLVGINEGAGNVTATGTLNAY